jgi:oxygen-independent coproporphyrinogen-3 oxidase
MRLNRENFVVQYPPLLHLSAREAENMWPGREVNLYVHIPYCQKKCSFCYYKSFEIGDGQIPDFYLEALKKEIEIYLRKPQLQDIRLRSLYIGGGTPSLLSEEQIEALILFVRSKFRFADDFEFCCEVRPGIHTTLKKLKLLKALGLRRLSIGCQSVDDEVLAVNGRNHEAGDFFETFERAREAGIFCISVDLMSGMINQSMESWMDSVETISKLRPENISIYKMEMYMNNILYRQYRKGDIRLISDKAEAEYAIAGYKKLLDDGYLFMDNYTFMSAPEYRHVQRNELWNGADMIGIGVSAHSCFNGYVYQNEGETENYLQKINHETLAIPKAHKITAKEKMIRQLTFGLKNMHFDRSRFEKEFGIDVMDMFGDKIKYMEDHRFISISPEQIDLLFDGAVFADDIVREFYLPEHRKAALAHIKRPEV